MNPGPVSVEGLSWQDVMERVGALAAQDVHDVEEADPVALVVAQHLLAGVRAFAVATQGEEGVAIRFSKVEERALLVVQPISKREERISAVGEPTFSLIPASQAWEAIASMVPQNAVFGARATEVGFQGRDLGPGDDAWAAESASLQVSVEAWPTPERPVRAWAHWWVAVGGHLYDLRVRDGAWVGVERPLGSVASEFEWAVVGAMDVLASGNRLANTPTDQD